MIQKLLATAVIILVFDVIWLSQFGTHLFVPMVENIQSESFSVHYPSAIAAYVILIIGLYVFCIADNAPIWKCVLFGLVTYGLFDTTNMAIFKDYDYRIAMIDTIWGGVLCGTTGYFISRLF